ncbi:MAG TPA: ABC transporter ATP-binding protein, partial [Chloroflexota bacterium]|nr:ABC transporter ATP-binding protein [Chloroflexota bacterium]
MSRRLEGMVRTARGLPAALALFGGGMGLVAGAAPVASAALVVLVLGAGLLALAQVWLGKVVVDELALVAGARGAQGEAASAGDLWPAALAASLYAVTMVVQQCYWPLQQALSGRIQERAAAEIDRRLMAAGGRLVDLGRVERPAFQDEVRVAQETNLLVSRLLQFVHQGAGNLLTLAGVLLLLARLHPLLPVALVLLGLPPLGVTQRMMQLALQSMAQRSRAAREAEYYTRLTVEPGAAKELRAFGLGDFFLRRFEARHEAALCEVSGLRYRELRAFLLLGGAQAVALAAGFWYVATQVGAGRLTLGDLALYLGAGARATDLLFAESFHNLSLALAQCKACFAILGAEPVITLPPRGRGLSAPPVLRHGIELRGVRFRYPEHDRDVLRDVSATLPAGQVTALVGANGAGKSTLVKLLTRMYDPTAGQLLLDGQPLPAYDLHSLRRR